MVINLNIINELIKLRITVLIKLFHQFEGRKMLNAKSSIKLIKMFCETFVNFEFICFTLLIFLFRTYQKNFVIFYLNLYITNFLL